METDPSWKYAQAKPIELQCRSWPGKIISKSPIWMSSDLRDGNQALVEPMNLDKKLRFFQMLLKVGFKEIEVAFPSASETDFKFVRKLIEENLIPDDVTISVLTQSREHLIRKTIESLKGVKRAIVHIYNPIAPVFRRVVYQKSKDEIIDIAKNGTLLLKSLVSQHPGTEWVFEYSPETFSMAELPVAKEICDTVVEGWGGAPDNKVIINLPSTVECSTPNLYADQIEWMHNNLANREAIVLSVHPHNDRGTAVAAAELAILAGADRVEGCLFGNGERTGNVDLITLALNMYSQGISPGLDFSIMDEVQQCYEYCSQLKVHPRHPYCGELVFTAFSGSHQDAIKKGFAVQNEHGRWEVPYLPIDPRDLGRNYDAVIRVNSQSGKGGVSYILEKDFNICLPRKVQIELSEIVQKYLDNTGAEAGSYEIYRMFCEEYINRFSPLEYISHKVLEDNTNKSKVKLSLEIESDGNHMNLLGTGNGMLDAAVNAISSRINVCSFSENSIGVGSEAEAICFIEASYDNQGSWFGVGVDSDIAVASFKGLISAINRCSEICPLREDFRAASNFSC